MRRAVILLAIAGCHFDHGQLPGDAGSLDDAGHEIKTWVIDTAADFQAGASQIDVGVDPWGSLTPAGYFYGGLTIAGLDGTALWHASDASFSFDAIAGHPPTATGRWSGQDITMISPTTYFGVTGATFSAWLVGEIQLPAGATQIRIDASDVGFVEIAEPHSDQFTQVVVAKGAPAMAMYSAATAGWHPIRIGWSSAGPIHQLTVQAGLPMASALGRDQLRGRAEGPRGLMRSLFDHQVLVASIDTSVHPRAQIVAEDAIAPTTFTPPLDGMPTGPFSVRWAGQFYATTAGSYTLEVDSTDGNGLAIAGASGESSFSVGKIGAVTTAVSPTFAVGWNDVTVDFNHVDGSSPSLVFKVTDGPEAALIGQALPMDRLRAVEPPADRLTCATDGATHNVPNQGTGTATLRFDGYPGETVTSLDVRLDFTNPELSGVILAITNPNNATFTFAPSTIAGTGQHVSTAHLDASTPAIGNLFNNAPAAGAWKVSLSDTIDSSGNKGGTLDEVDLALHLANGPAPLAAAPLWTSAVLDTTTQVASIDSISWMARDVPGLTATVVKLRACDMADCSDGTWIVVGNGLPAPADLTGKRYLQAQIAMTSDGLKDPEFQQLAITYRRNVM